MKKNDLKKVIIAASSLSGTIIGVGFFSLPYITLQSGTIVMSFYFIILVSFIYFIHKIFAEISILTPDFKRFAGFAKLYLGNVGEKISFFTTIFGLLGSLLAYLIVGGEFLDIFISRFYLFNNHYLFSIILYWFLGIILIFLGIKLISKIELGGIITLIFIILFLIFKERAQFSISNFNLFPQNLSLKSLFLPYGPILFSFWGAALIPEIEETLKEKKELLFSVIKLSIVIVSLVYILFIFFVLGISGKDTTIYFLDGLNKYLGKNLIFILAILGIFTTFTSFITLGLTLKKVLNYDLKIEKNLSFLITSFLPLFLFFLGIKNFLKIINFLGGVMLGIDGILILFMYKKIKPEKKKVIIPLIFLFLFGIIYEFFYLL